MGLGFGALIHQELLGPGETGHWAAVALFVTLPLIGLRVAAGRACVLCSRRCACGTSASACCLFRCRSSPADLWATSSYAPA